MKHKYSAYHIAQWFVQWAHEVDDVSIMPELLHKLVWEAYREYKEDNQLPRGQAPWFVLHQQFNEFHNSPTLECENIKGD